MANKLSRCFNKFAVLVIWQKHQIKFWKRKSYQTRVKFTQIQYNANALNCRDRFYNKKKLLFIYFLP